MQSPAAEDVAFVIDSLRRLVHGLRVSAHSAERDVGITGAQLFVLRAIAAEPGISIRGLSERTLTDPSSVSVVVARLVEHGFVTRKRDPRDGRASVLSVSARGRPLLARAPEPYQVRLIEALRALPRPALRQLRLGLTALLNAPGNARGRAPLFFEERTRRRRVGGNTRVRSR